MYCGYCGEEIPDGAVFCGKCGATVRRNPGALSSGSYNQNLAQPSGSTPNQLYSQNQNYGQNQGYSQNQSYSQNQGYNQNQNYNQNQGYAQNQRYAQNQGYAGGYQVFNTPGAYPGSSAFQEGSRLKKVASSTFFIITISLFSFAALWNLCCHFFGSSSIYSAMVQLYYRIDTLSDFGITISDIYAFYSPLNIIEAVFSLPSLAAAVGLWLIFFSAKNKRSSGFGTTGFTVIKIAEFVELGITALSFLALEGILFYVYFLIRSIYRAYGQSLRGEGFGIMFAIIGFAILIIFAVVALYYLLILRTVTGTQNAIEGKGSLRGSIFVAIVNILMAVYAVYGLVSTARTLIFYLSHRWGMLSSYISWSLGILYDICMAASGIMFAIMIFKYRKKA